MNRVQMNPLVMLKFLPFFMTMQLKAYCFAEQTDGPELDLDALAKSPGNILHIAVRRTAPDAQEAFAAGQVALRLANEGHEVSLISRHSLRQHQFDSDPGWLGPKYMKRFGREENPDKRRSMITEARHRGSVPPDVKRSLRRAIEQEELHWHEDEVKSIELTKDDITLSLGDGAEVKVDRVLLATGFEAKRPGGSMVNELVRSAALPCATCGFPVLDSALRWHPRIYVSGPLAELQIGPVARNIAGAQRASDRILNTLKRLRGRREQRVG